MSLCFTGQMRLEGRKAEGDSGTAVKEASRRLGDRLSDGALESGRASDGVVGVGEELKIDAMQEHVEEQRICAPG